MLLQMQQIVEVYNNFQSNHSNGDVGYFILVQTDAGVQIQPLTHTQQHLDAGRKVNYTSLSNLKTFCLIHVHAFV